jgi:DUF4097 and DUF4098 domain-containing protein YvlB
MRIPFLFLVLTAGLCLAAEEQNTVQRTFTVDPAEARLVVDTVEGNITVTGYSGSEIRATIQELWRGDTDADLQRVRSEVRLEIAQEGNTVRLYVDGPFRDRNGNGDWGRRYSARFDFEVQVPAPASVDLRTVNGSRIAVSGTNGAYTVGNVNGSIEMKEIGGSGAATTVNGKVAVGFRSNPTEPCTFKTVNGEIAAAFQPGLSADLTVNTLHGEARTDLPSITRAEAVEPAERQGARFIYKPDRAARLRAGSGGPELSFNTVNGSIQITEEGQ